MFFKADSVIHSSPPYLICKIVYQKPFLKAKVNKIASIKKYNSSFSKQIYLRNKYLSKYLYQYDV